MALLPPDAAPAKTTSLSEARGLNEERVTDVKGETGVLVLVAVDDASRVMAAFAEETASSVLPAMAKKRLSASVGFMG